MVSQESLEGSLACNEGGLFKKSKTLLYRIQLGFGGELACFKIIAGAEVWTDQRRNSFRPV
jgi:hypothetical protein